MILDIIKIADVDISAIPKDITDHLKTMKCHIYEDKYLSEDLYSTEILEELEFSDYMRKELDKIIRECRLKDCSYFRFINQ